MMGKYLKLQNLSSTGWMRKFKFKHICRLQLFITIVIFVAVVRNLKICEFSGKFQSNKNILSCQEFSSVRLRKDWTNHRHLDSCRSILQYEPTNQSVNCSDDKNADNDCDGRRELMFSQYGEDFYLYTRHFVHYKRPGIYLDVASNQ